jgi:hypothetical protein
MNYNQNDVAHLLSILKSDSSNAQTASEIESQLNSRFVFPKSGNQVMARGLITYAIELGHLIKSSTSSPAGYWLEEDPKEIEKYISSLQHRAKKINQRADNLKKNLE